MKNDLEIDDDVDIYFVAGLQHVSTPYTLHLTYLIVDDANIINSSADNDIFDALQNFVAPHAWGIESHCDEFLNYVCDKLDDDDTDNEILSQIADEEIFKNVEVFYTSKA